LLSVSFVWRTVKRKFVEWADAAVVTAAHARVWMSQLFMGGDFPVGVVLVAVTNQIAQAKEQRK
jgi:hypothetical protein